MKLKSTVLLVVAAGFGLVAMLGVMQVMQGNADEPKLRVLVAMTDVPAGMPLDETNVGFKEMPQSAVPSGAVTTPEEYAGKCLISRAVTGEIIMAAKLGGAESITASHQIPKGMRVATVSVDATKSHSGLIRPTDRVDVVCTYEVYTAGNRSKSKRVKTVLEFIAVFAVDNVRAGREGEVDTTVKNVSLLVDPEQFQLLTAAGKMGELALSLRNREDEERTDVAELTDSIFTQQDVSEGSREVETNGPAAQTSQEPQGPSELSQFLTSTISTMAEAATTPATAPATPKWTMTICRGGSIDDVEVLDEQALSHELDATERQRLRAETRDRSRSNEASPAKESAPNDSDANRAAATKSASESRSPSESASEAVDKSLPSPSAGTSPSFLPPLNAQPATAAAAPPALIPTSTYAE